MSERMTGLGLDTSRLVLTCRWFNAIVGLSLTGLLGVLAGGLIFGIGPGIAATLSVAGSWPEAGPGAVWQPFWQKWRRFFLAANVVAIAAAIAILALLADGAIMPEAEPVCHIAALLVATAALAFLAELGGELSLAEAARRLMRRPLRAAMPATTAALVLAAASVFPALAPFAALGCWALAVAFLRTRTG